ncbi:MAG: NAD/NADP octopine/nopaline dehydrogenase family protein [Bacteroidales bacterium]|nr:NAD/NADP octopine/nopaline dehydrogenase family protein [Bacteroidales bacterium]
MLTVTICGGGGLGHTCAGMFSRLDGIRVNMLTSRPEKWNRTFEVTRPDGEVLIGKLSSVTSEPEAVIPSSDIVLLCLPAYLVEETLEKIVPFLGAGTAVGTVVSNSGFFFCCHSILPADTPVFGFQRVPYVSRVIEYGRRASLLGDRPEIIVAEENVKDRDSFAVLLERLFAEKVVFADSIYEVTLSNSNPILHTGRLYTMWKDWDGKPFPERGYFYREWTVEASRLEIEMDREFFSLLEVLGVSTEHIDTLLVHYEAEDAEGMTAKIKSIESFKNIESPMVEVEGGWEPDFNSRYFTEDFPYGLRMIYELAHRNGVSCPNIDKVFEWGMEKCQGRR